MRHAEVKNCGFQKKAWFQTSRACFSLRDIAQVPPRHAAAAPDLVFCATRGSHVICWKSWCFCCFFYFFILSCVYTMSYRDELNEKLIDWKSLSKFWKIPWISSQSPYQTVVVTFTSCFVENVHCTLTHIVHQENITFLFLKYWQLRLPFFTPVTITRLHPSCLSQASFHVVTHYAHASVIAWWDIWGGN